MTVEERDKTIRITIDKCMRVLKEKAEGYSTDEDVLHNFRVAAGLQGYILPGPLRGLSQINMFLCWRGVLLLVDWGYRYMSLRDLVISGLTDIGLWKLQLSNQQ